MGLSEKYKFFDKCKRKHLLIIINFISAYWERCFWHKSGIYCRQVTLSRNCQNNGRPKYLKPISNTYCWKIILYAKKGVKSTTLYTIYVQFIHLASIQHIHIKIHCQTFFQHCLSLTSWFVSSFLFAFF